VDVDGEEVFLAGHGPETLSLTCYTTADEVMRILFFFPVRLSLTVVRQTRIDLVNTLPLIGGTFQIVVSSKQPSRCLSFGSFSSFTSSKTYFRQKSFFSLVLSVPLAWKYRPATGYVVGGLEENMTLRGVDLM
jgi:hypothetical protein